MKSTWEDIICEVYIGEVSTGEASNWEDPTGDSTEGEGNEFVRKGPAGEDSTWEDYTSGKILQETSRGKILQEKILSGKIIQETSRGKIIQEKILQENIIQLRWTDNVKNLTGGSKGGLWSLHKEEAVGMPLRMSQVAAIG